MRAILLAFWIAAMHAQTAGQGTAALEAGLAHFRAGRTGEARPLLERAVALSPENGEAWKMLGLVATSAGDLDGATASLRKACELIPKDEEACYYLARNLFVLGRYEAARVPFEKALQAAAVARVYRATALNYVALGLAAEAEQHFVKAIQLATGDAEDPRVDYGAFLFRQGRTQDALRPLRQAVQDAPASARANLELGRVLLHLDQLDTAAAHLEKAVRLDPSNSNAHLLLGSAYLRLGKTEEGEREMRLGRESWKR